MWKVQQFSFLFYFSLIWEKIFCMNINTLADILACKKINNKKQEAIWREKNKNVPFLLYLYISKYLLKYVILLILLTIKDFLNKKIFLTCFSTLSRLLRLELLVFCESTSGPVQPQINPLLKLLNLIYWAAVTHLAELCAGFVRGWKFLPAHFFFTEIVPFHWRVRELRKLLLPPRWNRGFRFFFCSLFPVQSVPMVQMFYLEAVACRDERQPSHDDRMPRLPSRGSIEYYNFGGSKWILGPLPVCVCVPARWARPEHAACHVSPRNTNDHHSVRSRRALDRLTHTHN